MDENLVVGKLTRTRAVLPKYLARMFQSLNLPHSEYHLQLKTGFDGSNSDDFDLHCHLQTILEGLDEMDPL